MVSGCQEQEGGHGGGGAKPSGCRSEINRGVTGTKIAAGLFFFRVEESLSAVDRIGRQQPLERSLGRKTFTRCGGACACVYVCVRARVCVVRPIRGERERRWAGKESHAVFLCAGVFFSARRQKKGRPRATAEFSRRSVQAQAGTIFLPQ